MNTKTRIINYITAHHLAGTEGQVPLDVSLLQTGLIDSFAFISIITFLETEFHIDIQDEEITPENLGSINKMASYVEGKIECQ